MRRNPGIRLKSGGGRAYCFGVAARPALQTFVWALVIVSVLVVSGGLILRSQRPEAIELQILQYSDWHGQLDPLDFPGEGIFGGAAELATSFRADEADNPNTLIITGGDDFGATPPLSGFLDEVPSVMAQNLMGTDVSALGNHNFDRGPDHLQRMIDLADYAYLGANLENMEGNVTGVESHKIFTIGGIDIGVIGVTNEDAKFLLFPGTLGEIEVTDAVAAAQGLRDELAEQGVDVIILVAHIGALTAEPPTGDLIDLANSLHGFDLILGDHTDVHYSGTINGALVVENRSKGRSYARIQIQVTEEGVVSKSLEFVEPLSAGIEPASDVIALLEEYRTKAAPSLNVVVGTSTVPIPREDSCGLKGGNGCESLIGNIVTDAMRAQVGSDFAIINSGAFGSDLTCPVRDDPKDFCPEAVPPRYPINRERVFAAIPLGLRVVTVSVSGPELKAYLERGASHTPISTRRFAQVSGLCFTANTDLEVDSRVTSAVYQGADGRCDTGSPIDLGDGTRYTIAITDYMASGGDGYPNVLVEARVRSTLEDVLIDYLAQVDGVSPSIQGRVICVGAGCTTPRS